MGSNEEKKGMSKFDKVLITVGSIGGVFGAIMALYLDPIKDKIIILDSDIKKVEISAKEDLKTHCENDSAKFRELENDIKELENESKIERKETNSRLRKIEQTTATILEKINNLKTR